MLESSIANVLDTPKSTSRVTSRRCIAIALTFASGFAALGYQIIWTQQSSLWLGHEAVAVLAVIAAFFGGLSIGSLSLGGRIDRSTRPTYWYAACEFMVGAWSLVLAFIAVPVANMLLDLIGAQPAPNWHLCVAFLGTFLLFLPATAAMGATLPAMERTMASLRREGTSIAELYASNTLGAVLGVVLAAFWLVPSFGLVATACICVVLNVFCATASLRVFSNRTASLATTSPSSALNHLWLLAATGLLGIGCEVLVVRALSQVAENTVYTFAILLAIYLLGTALGATAYARWFAARKTKTMRDDLLIALAASCLVTVLTLAAAVSIKTWTLHFLGNTMIAALSAEAVIGAVAFLPPTIVMGALFSHLCIVARDAGFSFGHALGVNTVGAALAPTVFGVVLLPQLGAGLSLLVIAGCYLMLATRRAWFSPKQWAVVAATIALAIWGPALVIVDVPEGGHLVSYQEGSMAAVSVVADEYDVMRLHIDNRQQEGSSATLLADARQALLPILLHPAPRHALFLGLGTGVTAMSAAEDSQLQVDAVELLPEVIAAAEYFKGVFDANAGRDARFRVINADARRFVRATGKHYDVIVADNFHPARSGSGSLYTVEHFEAVRARLAPGGLFCQWLPLHQLDLQTLRIIVRSFLEVYPHVSAILATNSLETPVVGLIARRDEDYFDVAKLDQRLKLVSMPHATTEFGINDDLALLGSFIASETSLARFARGATLNTDDRPTVAYVAPRITYAPDSSPRDRLLELLHELKPETRELIAPSQDIAWNSRLNAYWSARNRFLEVGRDVQPTANVQQMLAQVCEPLLSVLHASPDFRPAYDPLLRMAMALQSVDAIEARSLLTELSQIQPLRSEAAEALQKLRTAAN